MLAEIRSIGEILGRTWDKEGPIRNPITERGDQVDKGTKDSDLRPMINLRTQEREATRRNIKETQVTVSNPERRATSDDTHKPKPPPPPPPNNEVQIVERHTQGTPARRTEPHFLDNGGRSGRRERSYDQRQTT